MLLKELLFIQDGLLWHRHWKPITSMPDQPQQQLVVPTGLRTAILKACHNDILTGHLGFNKTYNKIKCRFWWPNVYSEVRAYVLGCISCQRRKPPRRNLKGELQPHLVTHPWQRMSMDLLGPLPRSKSGNTYLLVCNDNFTRWVEAFAISDIKMPNIARIVLTRIICGLVVQRKSSRTAVAIFYPPPPNYYTKPFV